MIFDLRADPAESMPVPAASLPSGVLEAALALQKAKNDSIFATFRSVADYTNGRGSIAGPCCNEHEPACRCQPGDAAAAEEGRTDFRA